MSFSVKIKRITACMAAMGLAIALSAGEAAAQVTTLTGWVSGTTNAKVSGSNRLMVVMAMGEHPTADFSATGATYGGQTMTKQAEKMWTNGGRTYVSIFTLNEAGVNAASSGTITIAWSSNPTNGNNIYSVLLGNVDQAAPIGATATNALDGTTVTTNALTAASGDMIIFDGGTGSNNTITFNNGFTKGFESNGGWGDGVGAFKMGTGASETPSFTQSASGRMVICAMVVKKSSGGTTNYTLTPVVVPAGSGSIALNPAGGTYANGTIVTITASATGGYSFSNWSGNASGTSPTSTVTMTANKSVTANFALKTYQLTVNVESGGQLDEPSTSPVTVNHGVATTITASAIPSTSFYFVNWTVTAGTAAIANANANSTTVTLISGNATVLANFVLSSGPKYPAQVTGVGQDMKVDGSALINGDFTVMTGSSSFGVGYDDLRFSSNGFYFWNNSGGGGYISCGPVECTSVKINNWTIEAPDYVFEKGYKLASLSDVEKHIAENKHLPGVPSAQEMKNGGVDLSELNMTLLKKVEELTLYMIEQNKKIEAQQQEIDKLNRAAQK